LESPVAVRRVHGSNRITATRSAELQFRGYHDMWQSCLRWCSKQGFGDAARVIARRQVRHHFAYWHQAGNRKAAFSALRSCLASSDDFRQKILYAVSWVREYGAMPIWKLKILIGRMFGRARRSRNRVKST